MATRSKETSRRVARGLLALVGLGSIAGLQGLYDHSSSAYQQEINSIERFHSDPFIPSTNLLKTLSLGQNSLVADILWLQTIQYFGGGDPYGKYAALPKILTTITTLDPKFEYPYEFALVVLPFMGGAQTAAQLGEQAQKELPNNGLLTYYLATVYQINLKDYAKAAHYYQLASTQPGAPTAAQELAGVSYSKINGTLNDRLVAADFWKTVYENAKSDDQKEQAKNWYEHMLLVYQIENAASQYHAKNGHFPASLQALVDAGYVPTIPVSPVHRALDLDPATGKVSFDRLLP